MTDDLAKAKSLAEKLHLLNADRQQEEASIVEEVLVVERRLLLKEEVHVRRVRSTERHQESVTLRHQEAVVTRLPVETPAAGQNPDTGEKVQQSNQE